MQLSKNSCQHGLQFCDGNHENVLMKQMVLSNLYPLASYCIIIDTGGTIAVFISNSMSDNYTQCFTYLNNQLLKLKIKLDDLYLPSAVLIAERPVEPSKYTLHETNDSNEHDKVKKNPTGRKRTSWPSTHNDMNPGFRLFTNCLQLSMANLNHDCEQYWHSTLVKPMQGKPLFSINLWSYQQYPRVNNSQLLM